MLTSSRQRQALEETLRLAHVQFNGPNPWDLRVHDERFYERAAGQGLLGIGESYVEGWWDCPRIDELAYRVLSQHFLDHVKNDWRTALAVLQRRFVNAQAPRNGQVVAAHYDQGNKLFQGMLGRTMMYSCAYWQRATTLDDAQEDKLDLICKKLQLRTEDRVLDIGCGWGGFPRHAARKHGCHVTGITISKEQCAYATAACKGLPVKIVLADYRDESLKALGPFSKVVSIGMFEHVGTKNHRHYMEIVHDLLAAGGLFLLHTIGNNQPSGIGPWIDKYIFPFSTIPCVADVCQAIDRLFVMEDWHNFGAYYDPTLMAWYNNLDKHADELPGGRDGMLYRRWKYFLLTCAGMFRVRKLTQVWQVALSKNGVPGGYVSIR